MIDYHSCLNRPIFVVGCPKSGTSLLVALLDGHENIAVLTEESDFFPEIHGYLNWILWNPILSRRSKAKRILQMLFTETHFKNYLRGEIESDISGNFDYRNFDKTRFEDAFYDFLLTNKFTKGNVLSAIVHAYMSAFTEQLQDSPLMYWLEKTPRHTFFLPKIKTIYPNAKVIFVTRDARDNFVSYKKKHPQLNVMSFCDLWLKSLHCFEDFQEANRQCCHALRYEDLVANTEHELQKLMNFLDLPVHDSLFCPTKLGKAWSGNSMFGDKHSKISTVALDRYKTTLSAEEVKQIESQTHLALLRLGYQVDLPYDQAAPSMKRELKKKRVFTQTRSLKNRIRKICRLILPIQGKKSMKANKTIEGSPR